jgi:predicted ATP-grasp superfamily ATP-dependent carboligase
MKVLLTDGNYKHTLAAVRSLGKQGVEVGVVSHIPCSVSFCSRYCVHRYHVPDPKKDPLYAQRILDIVKKDHYDVLLPVSYAAVMQLAGIKDELEHYVHLPIADPIALDLAGHKDETVKIAEKVGVRVPKTYYPHNIPEVRELARELRYPVVVKGAEEAGYVGYANTPEELISRFSSIVEYLPIVQEYISGDGYGFFALYNRGEPRAIFMHRRVREYPVTGGPSTCAESVFDPELKRCGMAMLNELRWHGVAMVEFKKDAQSGEYVLMEINPKFWGSLDLSIASGVNFPYLACRMALEGDVGPVFEYQVGTRFRWLFPGEIFHGMTNPRALPQIVREFFDGSTRSDVELGDIVPNIVEVGMTGAEFILRVAQGRFWRAHGQVRR